VGAVIECRSTARRAIPDHEDAARLLIIDDEPADVRQLERLLHAAGYRCIHGTTDAREVIVHYRGMRPDLVLLDLTMPDIDGIAVLTRLKTEIIRGDYVPVVAITEHAAFEAKQRALTAGVNDFLAKPFDQLDVVLRVSNLLRTRRLYRALEQMRRERRMLTRRILASHRRR
jgi:PleD family two-component response regulator